MKKTRITILILVHTLLVSCLYSQSIVNNGAKIINRPGSFLVIHGDLINKSTGNLLNNGNIDITGDWINNASTGSMMQGSTGQVQFNGASIQAIDGTAVTYFHRLFVESDIQVGSEIHVQNQLALTSHNVQLYGILQMDEGSAITGAGPMAYVSIPDAGKLVQVVGDWPQLFPVGTAASFCPVEVQNHISESYGYFSVNVFPDVLDEGVSGSSIGSIDHCVNLTWFLEKINPDVVDLSITTHWNASDEGTSFDRTRCGTGHYLPGDGWVPQVEGIASGTDPYSITRHDITDPGAFATGDVFSPLAKTLHLSLDIRAFLEGPFNGTSMDTRLADQGMLPLAQPFGSPPWFYPGTENVPGIPNDDVVDWVLVELRDAPSAPLATPATAMERKAAFLLRGGAIVAMDGTSDLEFANELSENLFVVIWHRNHLGVMSAYPLEGIGGVYAYDFSVSSDMAYGGSTGHKNLGSGIFGMFAGDGDANGAINLSDNSNVWYLQAGEKGYHSGDYNLDGQVNNPDKNDYWDLNISAQSQVPE